MTKPKQDIEISYYSKEDSQPANNAAQFKKLKTVAIAKPEVLNLQMRRTKSDSNILRDHEFQFDKNLFASVVRKQINE